MSGVDLPDEIPYEEGDDLVPSKLGTKAHWDGVYEREVEVFEDTGDEGEVWFGESSVMKMVSWAITNIPPSPSHPISILECGCGNGTLLLSFLSPSKFHRPYTNSRFVGVDYSAASIELAKQVEVQRRARGWRSLEEEDSVENDEVYDSDSGGEERDKRVMLARGAKVILGKGTIEWVVGDLLEPWDSTKGTSINHVDASASSSSSIVQSEIKGTAIDPYTSSTHSSSSSSSSFSSTVSNDPNQSQSLGFEPVTESFTHLGIHLRPDLAPETNTGGGAGDRPENARHVSTDTVRASDHPGSLDRTLANGSITGSHATRPDAALPRSTQIRRAMSPDARRRRERQQQNEVFQREHMSPRQAEGVAKPVAVVAPVAATNGEAPGDRATGLATPEQGGTGEDAGGTFPRTVDLGHDGPGDATSRSLPARPNGSRSSPSASDTRLTRDTTSRPLASWQEPHDLVLDKGTYDALALSSDPVPLDPMGRKPAEVYPERISALVKLGGFFLITSCNFTEEQIEARFAKQELGFSFHSRVNHASFSFAGRQGSTVCTVAFQKTS